METRTPDVYPTTNDILSAFFDSSEPIPRIADQLRMQVIDLAEWLAKRAPLIRTLTDVVELRARFKLFSAELVAVDSLKTIAEFDRDPERRRKASTKILCHVAYLRRPVPRRTTPDATDPAKPDLLRRPKQSVPTSPLPTPPESAPPTQASAPIAVQTSAQVSEAPSPPVVADVSSIASIETASRAQSCEPETALAEGTPQSATEPALNVPIGTPVESPVESPTEMPNATPIETPVETTAEMPAEMPVDTSTKSEAMSSVITTEHSNLGASADPSPHGSSDSSSPLRPAAEAPSAESTFHDLSPVPSTCSPHAADPPGHASQSPPATLPVWPLRPPLHSRLSG